MEGQNHAWQCVKYATSFRFFYCKQELSSIMVPTAFDMMYMYRSHKIQYHFFFYKKGIALPSSLATDSAFAIGISAGAAANAGSTTGTGSSICGAGA